MPTDSPPFLGARRHAVALAGWGGLLCIFGVLLLDVGAGRQLPAASRLAAVVPGSLCVTGPALLLGAAALLSAALAAWSRARVSAAAKLAEPDAMPAGTMRALARAALPAAWPQAVLAILLGSYALAGLALAVRLDVLDRSGTRTTELAVGGAFLLAAFALLVLERHLAGTGPAELPEAAETAWVLRLPVAVLVAMGIAGLLHGAGYRPVWLVRAAALLVGLVAVEILARAVADLFLPPAPPGSPRHVVRSGLVRLIRAAPPSPAALGGAIQRQFGIDLARSWALGFLRRAAVPTLACVALAGWLLTGVTALGMSERAVYHRLGEPVAVLRPGLHLHLPWPFGTVRKVELDVMHEVALNLPEGAARRAAVAPVDAEAPPPESADRLWTGSHPSEATYLIASEAQGQQGFQAVDIDLRLVFRAGRSDQAARDLAFQADPPGRLLRATAGRFLARYFATHTLDGVLGGADRDAFAAEVRTAVQRDLDALGAGLDLVAVVVEAIHPPPAAASAYQQVQAAEIRSREAIWLQEGNAAQTIEAARSASSGGLASARTVAADAVAEARAQQRLFDADREANRRNPGSFLFERRLERLGAGLGRAQLLVLDHRLEDGSALLLDMRPGSAGPTVP